MNRRRVLISYLTLLLALGGCTSPKSRTPDAGVAATQNKEAQGQVELLRDSWGVPHVFADTDAGAMYGLGYAAAQDRPFQMYYNLRIIQGRLAEVVGDVKVGVTRQQPEGRNSALRSDIQMRTIGYWRAAQETAERLDPEARGLLEAYSRGVNDCLSSDPNARSGSVREVRPGARAVDAGGVHRLLVAAGPVLRRRRPAGDDAVLRNQGGCQEGTALHPNG